MQGSLEVSTCPSLIPSTPWLTWPQVLRLGLREGEGGCSLGPGRRRQEALCFCNAPETPVLPPACLPPPSLPASLCEALFILQPWQPDPACSQRGARQSLPAPAWSWKPQRLPAKHNYPAVDTVVDFREGREGQEGRREAAKAFNASLANLQLALAILHPIPAPHLHRSCLGEVWASNPWVTWATYHRQPPHTPCLLVHPKTHAPPPCCHIQFIVEQGCQEPLATLPLSAHQSPSPAKS